MTDSPINALEHAIREAIRLRGVERARQLFRAEPNATTKCVSAILKAAIAHTDGVTSALSQRLAGQTQRNLDLAQQADEDTRTIGLLRTELNAERRHTAELAERLTAAQDRIADELAVSNELRGQLAMTAPAGSAQPATDAALPVRQTRTGPRTSTGKGKTGTGRSGAAG